jgi:hypothetical protein
MHARRGSVYKYDFRSRVARAARPARGAARIPRSRRAASHGGRQEAACRIDEPCKEGRAARCARLIIQRRNSSAFMARRGTTLTSRIEHGNPRLVAWRLLWIRLVDLASEHDANLFAQLLGHPFDFPNLARLRPPCGNTRPSGVSASHFARRARGELPAIY